MATVIFEDTFDMVSQDRRLISYTASGGGTVGTTYNATYKSLDLSNSGAYQTFFVLEKSVGYRLGKDYTYEADIELLSDVSARKHFGITLSQSKTDFGSIIHRFNHLDNLYGISYWSNISTGVGYIPDVSDSSIPFIVGNRRTLKVSIKGNQASFYVDNIFITSVSLLGDITTLTPGIFVYGCSIRLHSVKITYDTSGVEDTSKPYYSLIQLSNPTHYWPCLHSIYDVQPNAQHMYNRGYPSEGVPHTTDYLPPYHVTDNSSGGLNLPQVILGTVTSIETTFLLDSMSTANARSSTILALNQVSDNIGRRILFWYTSAGHVCFEWYIQTGASTFIYLKSTKTLASLSDKPHHVYIEYDSTTGNSYTYIDGILDSALTYTGNIFTIDAYPRSPYISFGNYLYSSAFAAGVGNSYISNIAVYDKKLTSTELSSRISLLNNQVSNKIFINQALLFGNQETKSQAWPGENQWSKLANRTVEYFNSKDFISNYPVLDKLGYFQGKVTIDGDFTKGVKISCLDERYNIIKETYTDSNGYYILESLNNNTKYIITAYDNDLNGYDPLTIKTNCLPYPKTTDSLDFDFKEAAITGMLRIGDRLLVINGGKLCALPPQN